MISTLATWEDEAHNRQIQFSVDYAIENGAVEIKSVTPIKVSFVCPKTNTCFRSVGVWTESGRRGLAQVFTESDAFDRLALAIAGPNADFGSSDLSVRQEIGAAG